MFGFLLDFLCRHSRAGGNPEWRLKGTSLSDKFLYGWVWIPACAGMTAVGCYGRFRRPPSFQLRLKLPFRAHAYASGTLVECVLAVGAGNEYGAAAVEHVVGIERDAALFEVVGGVEIDLVVRADFA